MLSHFGGDQVDGSVKIDGLRVLVLGNRGVQLSPFDVRTKFAAPQRDRLAVLGVLAQHFAAAATAGLRRRQQFQRAAELQFEDAVGLGQRFEDPVVFDVGAELTAAQFYRFAIGMHANHSRQRQEIDGVVERGVLQRLFFGPAGALGLGQVGAVAFFRFGLGAWLLGWCGRRFAQLHVVTVRPLAQIHL